MRRVVYSPCARRFAATYERLDCTSDGFQLGMPHDLFIDVEVKHVIRFNNHTCIENRRWRMIRLTAESIADSWTVRCVNPRAITIHKWTARCRAAINDKRRVIGDQFPKVDLFLLVKADVEDATAWDGALVLGVDKRRYLSVIAQHLSLHFVILWSSTVQFDAILLTIFQISSAACETRLWPDKAAGDCCPCKKQWWEKHLVNFAWCEQTSQSTRHLLSMPGASFNIIRLNFRYAATTIARSCCRFGLARFRTAPRF